MIRNDQIHCSQRNKEDLVSHPSKRDKFYIPPSFHHHFGRRWRSLHARPQDTCAHKIMHATSLHHKYCSNKFSSFSNLNPGSICLVRGGDFFPCGFSPSSLYWAVTLLYLTVLVTRDHRLSKLAFRGGIRIINPPLSNLVICLNQESCLNRESF